MTETSTSQPAEGEQVIARLNAHFGDDPGRRVAHAVTLGVLLPRCDPFDGRTHPAIRARLEELLRSLGTEELEAVEQLASSILAMDDSVPKGFAGVVLEEGDRDIPRVLLFSIANVIDPAGGEQARHDAFYVKVVRELAGDKAADESAARLKEMRDERIKQKLLTALFKQEEQKGAARAQLFRKASPIALGVFWGGLALAGVYLLVRLIGRLLS